MSTHLLDEVKQALPPNFADMAGGLLGESGATTGNALGSLLPMLIATLAQKCASPAGAQTVMALLDNPAVNTSALSNLVGLFSGGGVEATSIIAYGRGIVSSLFGDKAGALASALSSISGIRSPQSATNLVALVAPIVLAVIKRQVTSGNTGASGLASLLAGQGRLLQGALDGRLTSALGFASPASMLSPLSIKGGDAATEPIGLRISRWWPWILAAIVLAFLLSRGEGGEKPVEKAAAPATIPAPARASAASDPAVPPALRANGVAETSINIKQPANFSGTGGDAGARRAEASKAP